MAVSTPEQHHDSSRRQARSAPISSSSAGSPPRPSRGPASADRASNQLGADASSTPPASKPEPGRTGADRVPIRTYYRIHMEMNRESGYRLLINTHIKLHTQNARNGCA